MLPDEELLGKIIFIIIGAVIGWKILTKLLAAFFQSDLGQILFMLLRWLVTLCVIFFFVFIALSFLGYV